MSTQLIERYESFSLAANDRKIIAGQFDFVYFEALPAGVTVSINGEPHRARQEGSIRAGVPGRDDLVSVEFLNTTGGALAVAALFGNGSFEISGQVSLVGSIALPTGASTAALQTTGNTTLASILAGLAALATHALQTAGNALLTTIAGLAATTAETPGFAALGISADQTYSGKKTLVVLNSSTTQNVTLNLNGGGDLTLGPGQTVGWEVKKPLATLGSIRVRTTGSGSANVSFTE